MFLYFVLGLLSMWMIYHTMKEEQRIGRTVSWNNKYLIIVSLIWTFFATFRLVNFNGVGGMDANSYIYFFEKCNNRIYSGWMLHVGDDWIFKWTNKVIRFLTADYKIYFALVYGFMAWAYLWFAVKFTPVKNNIVPYLLCFFLFWRSFNTLRSNFAIAFIMVSCAFMLDKKWRYAYCLAFLSGFIHKAAFLFALVVPFVQIFSEYKLKIYHIVSFIILSGILGGIFQQWFIQYASITDLQGAYGSYASKSLEGGGFFSNFWKIAFEQMLLGVFMFFCKNKIECLKSHSESDSNRINIVWLICVFDLILIPLCYILSIWRGYEIFYIPRIVMWGIILYIILRKYRRLKNLMALLIFLLFFFWFYFRIESMYENSGLMPYVLEFLI